MRGSDGRTLTRAQGAFDAELIATANAIATAGKGILAADESTGTIGKRFDSIKLENNHENRRKYRELLFRTKGLGQYISGCILFEETLFDVAQDGKTKLVELLQAENIAIGIKLDLGQQPIAGAAQGETATEGLDGLAKRCALAYKQGARFAKWRAVVVFDPKTGAPTQLAIDEQVRGLARYASICQANGLVPVVEPEVLMDGAHTVQQAAEVTERVWANQIKALADHHILLEGCLLKPNMVRHGEKCPTPASIEEIGFWTAKVLSNTIPPAIPGINFLSGGMSEEDATLALNAINTCQVKKPWTLSFSYGRALQVTVLKVWQGKDENVVKAQAALLHRAQVNSLACQGKYTGSAVVDASAKQSQFVANYTY